MHKLFPSLLGLSFLFFAACSSGDSSQNGDSKTVENIVQDTTNTLSTIKNLVVDSVKLTWTAYKTMDKIPVSGTFKDIVYQFNTNTSKPLELLDDARMEIATATVFSGNEERDKKLWDYFFQMMMDTNQIEARVQQVNPSSDQAVIVIRMNNKEIPVTFALTTKDGRLQGDADIDVVKQFHAGRALYHLHTACEQQHTGPDGVSKTWPDVHLTFKVYYHQAK